MALNLKNPEVEKLIAEVAERTGVSKTEALRIAMIQRKARLQARASMDESTVQRLRDFLEFEIWPHIPEEELGRSITRGDVEGILGYGPDGV